MKKYRVNVNRIGYANKIFEISAQNKNEAKARALDDAGNFEFSEHNAEYEIEDIIELEE